MDAALSEVRRQYAAAYRKVMSLGTKPEEVAIKANFGTLRARIDKWAETYRGWALAGVRDNGTAYTAARWLEYGRELADEVRLQSGEAFDRGLFAALAATAAATVEQVASPTLWPPWLKWAGVAVGVAVLAGVAWRVARAGK